MSPPSLRRERLDESVEPDQRRSFERDRDRVLYTRAFRRLSGVAQVARAEESYTYHDRLSHSLKVAQIGRRMAEHFVRDNDGPDVPEGLFVSPDVVETAALVHDIGHPPFGHAAEQELDRAIRDRGVKDGFEGNAQSFRIVTKLATHDLSDRGLNLTKAVLNAVLKYPWHRDKDRLGDDEPTVNEWGVDECGKWGAYETERDALVAARELGGVPKRQSAEAAIMDWADDLAYAVHDVEDFYRAGIIPLEQLFDGGTAEREEFLADLESAIGIDESEAADALDYIASLQPSPIDSPFRGTADERKQLKGLSSKLISRYVGSEDGGVSLQSEDSTAPVLRVADALEREVAVLKHMTLYYVISDATLRAQQRGHREIVSDLFEIAYGATLPTDRDDHEDPKLLPNRFRSRARSLREAGDTQARARFGGDFLTSLTEKQALGLHDRLTGHSPGSLQERIFR